MLRRIIEFFWRGEAMRKASAGLTSERASAVAAMDLLDSGLLLGGSEGTQLAQALLFGEAVSRAATALGFEPGPDKTAFDHDSVKALVSSGRISDATLTAARAAADAEGRPSDDLPKAEQVTALRQVAERLVRECRGRSTTRGELHVQRWFRIMLVAAILVGPIVTALWVHPWWLFDKSRGATWVVSAPHKESKPTGTLDKPPDDFFFASDFSENPWLIIDLGDVESISKIRLVNRPVHTDHSFPVIVETSVDREHWEQVARRDEVYHVWVASFRSRKARYVRLTVPRSGVAFALNDVQVL